MTETQSHYQIPGSHNMAIPSRDEFHRYAVEKLAASDFSADHPSGYLIGKIARSLRWTVKNAEGKTFVNTL